MKQPEGFILGSSSNVFAQMGSFSESKSKDHAVQKANVELDDERKLCLEIDTGILDCPSAFALRTSSVTI